MLKVKIFKKLKEFDLDVNFEINKGVLGILGASGSGKSMTLKAIAGLVDIDKGLISLDEKVLFDNTSKINIRPQNRNVGYLFQNYALFPNMSVRKNVSIGLKNKDDIKLEELINKFRLKEIENRYPYQLSGGQQQRVALARLLAYEPDVILLDEPFSAMDSFLKDELKEQLTKILNEYKGIAILVTHDRDEAFQLCDNLIIIDKGKIIRFGKTIEVFKNPKAVVAARLLGCKNISRIKIIDKNHIQALDFDNIVFEVNDIDDNDIKYIGIRAHDIKIGNKTDENSFVCSIETINSTPFEWNIKLKNGMIWKINKEISDLDFCYNIKYLQINREKIMLLK